MVIRELRTHTLILSVCPSGRCTMASVLLSYLFCVPSIITYLTFRRGPNNSIKTDDSDIMEKPGGYCGIPNPKGWVNLSTRRARLSVRSSKALRRARMSWNSYSE